MTVLLTRILNFTWYIEGLLHLGQLLLLVRLGERALHDYLDVGSVLITHITASHRIEIVTSICILVKLEVSAEHVDLAKFFTPEGNSSLVGRIEII